MDRESVYIDNPSLENDEIGNAVPRKIPNADNGLSEAVSEIEEQSGVDKG